MMIFVDEVPCWFPVLEIFPETVFRMTIHHQKGVFFSETLHISYIWALGLKVINGRVSVARVAEGLSCRKKSLNIKDLCNMGFLCPP